MSRQYVIVGILISETTSNEFVISGGLIDETVAITGIAVGTIAAVGSGSGGHGAGGTAAAVIDVTAAVSGAHGAGGTATGLIELIGTASGTHDPAIITGIGIATAAVTGVGIGLYGGIPNVGETRQYIIAGGISFFVNETTDHETQHFSVQVDQIGSEAVAAITGTAAGEMVVTADAIGTHSGVPRLATGSRSRRLDPSVRRPIAAQVRRAQAHYPSRRRTSDAY